MKTWTTTAAVAFACLLSALTGCELLMASIKGSGTIITESRKVGEFDSVDISGTIKARIISGENWSVEVTTDDNLVPLVETHVVDGTLQLSMKPGSYSPTNAIEVRVTTRSIHSVEVAGACNVAVEAIEQDNLTADVSGASKLSLEGRCDSLDVRVSGASELAAGELSSATIDVDVSGASKATVLALESIAGDVNGSSKLTYGGDPAAVDVETSEASSARPK